MTKISREEKARETLKFPDCIGRFEDEHCQTSTEVEPSVCCKICPFFKHYTLKKDKSVTVLESKLAKAKQELEETEKEEKIYRNTVRAIKE